MSTLDEARFGWSDFEEEVVEEEEGAYYTSIWTLTIYEYGEELATITHRETDKHSIDTKRENAERIVAALREYHGER